MNGHIVTFGEIMMRLSPANNLRFRQAQSLELVYGGAEANVAIALANFGMPVQFVTRLPDNELGLSCLSALRQQDVGADFIDFGGQRLGLYFLEVGVGNRPSQVIYDRANSSFATIHERLFSWETIVGGASWFHWSGISPALSAGAAKVTAQAVVAAREAGLTVSCDLNYRHTLWQWGSTPAEIMPGLISQCDVLSANTSHLMLGIDDLPIGKSPEEAADACARLSAIYPNLKQITMTCRESTATGEQRFTAVMWHLGELYTSKTFSLTTIVDRIGAGDAHMAGLIYGLVAFPHDPQRVIDFAAASAVLKHTIRGDANLASVEEVARLLSPDHGFDIIR